MPICITGMHRSGTSMVARLLNICGLYLGPTSEIVGPAADNEAGFWENVNFLAINDELLERLGGGWDLPPPAIAIAGWELREDIADFRKRAADLIETFSFHRLWGWKDPRNSLTLRFWKHLIPDLQVVICVRNPIEVALSLQKRGYSSRPFSMKLWQAHYQQLLAETQSSQRVVTHYNSYFSNPQSELRRVLKLLQTSAPSEFIERACSTIATNLRHSWAANEQMSEARVPPEVVDSYQKLCDEAGGVYAVSVKK